MVVYSSPSTPDWVLKFWAGVAVVVFGIAAYIWSRSRRKREREDKNVLATE